VTRKAEAGPVTERAHRSDARAAARVGAGIFLSRLFGFVRVRVFAHWFGAGDFADAWGAALKIPNVLQNLLGEGTLSASLIPVYAELLEEGREADAGRFAGAALGILTVVAGSLALLGVVLAQPLVSLFLGEWDAEKQALTVALIRILFPMAGILVIAAWALGILNSHRRFFVSYVAPVFWNLAIITTLVAGGSVFALGLEDLVLALAWGALVGGALQLGVQLPFVVRHLRGFRLSLGRGVHGVDEAVRNFGPVVAARGVVNLSGLIDVFLAGRLMDGAVALLGYAQTFYVLPISLFGMSVAASELPELSRMRGETQRILAERVRAALRRVAFFLIPSTLGYLALGDVIVAALYQTGSFGPAHSLVTWGVLAAYTLGLTASASSRVLSSAFYALRDTRTPARVALVRVVLSAAVGFALMTPLDRFGFATLHLGAAGLALGASVAAWMEYVLLRRALGSRIGSHGPGSGPLARMTLAGALAAAAGVGLQLVLPPAHPLVTALETLVPFGVVYLASASVLGVGMPLRRPVAP
jgi:putative peptidoglycan lipid II flippase